jgi:hypothetical protein
MQPGNGLAWENSYVGCWVRIPRTRPEVEDSRAEEPLTAKFAKNSCEVREETIE